MFFLALAFLLGVSLTATCAGLHTDAWFAGVLLMMPLAWRMRASSSFTRVTFLLCVMFAGGAWASWRAGLYLDHRLPESLAGHDILVSGRIIDIPVQQEGVQRFGFELDDFDLDHSQPGLSQPPRKLRLSWYYAAPVHAGERWRLRVRLKPPHGFFNPGGFDYEGWLYQQGVHATGYVRDDESNLRLEPAGAWSIDTIRQRIFERTQSRLAGVAQAGAIAALAVGERSAIDGEQWQQLIATGTNHLMAISGLHIGLAASFGYLLTRRVLCRFMPAHWFLSLPAQHMAIITGGLLALVYALLAGLSVPTQRALLMLASFSAAWLLRRNPWAFDALGLAMVVILLWQPVSVLSPGFWFSFLAVGVIIYVCRGDGTGRGRWMRWGGIQLVIALALMPLSLFMFQQGSLVAPLANLVMVPYVSLLVVPLVLMSMLLMPLSPWASDGLLQLAALAMQAIWPLLEHLSALEFARWVRPQPELWTVVLALSGLGWLLAPKARLPNPWWRALGVIPCLPLLILRPDAPAAGDFELHQLDVGQGLSAVIRTQEHVLVYDTGARLGPQLDAGRSVVVPFLRQLGADRLDRLVVSHGDADHIGGAASVLAAYPSAELTGRDIDSLEAVSKTICAQGQHWRWDGVDFEFLSPGDVLLDSHGRRNNHSCVLRVSNDAGAALLTGDIEHDVEERLLTGQPEKLGARVLMVPHHGSKTSSSPEFIARVNPEIALLPAGYRNRYRLPAAEITQRYQNAGAKLLVSGLEGAVSIVFSSKRDVSVIRRYRRDQHHYWNHLSPLADEPQSALRSPR